MHNSVTKFIGFLLLVSGVSLLLFPYFFGDSDRSLPPPETNSVTQSATQTVEQLPEQPILPIAISIPAIEVEAEVEQVGINENGNMSVPSSYQTVGWFEPGFKPGSFGNAVLAGHVDNSLGLDGVFKKLDLVLVGDTIELEDESGVSQTYVVTEIESIDYRTDNIEYIFGLSDVPQIRLITCSGDWLSEYKTYDQRLIVTAVLEDYL